MNPRPLFRHFVAVLLFGLVSCTPILATGKTDAQPDCLVFTAGNLLGDLNGAATGANAAWTADVFNRQLHPNEAQWIKDNAKEFAQKEGISEQEATERLTQEALKEVDCLVPEFDGLCWL